MLSREYNLSQIVEATNADNPDCIIRYKNEYFDKLNKQKNWIPTTKERVKEMTLSKTSGGLVFSTDVPKENWGEVDVLFKDFFGNHVWAGTLEIAVQLKMDGKIY